MVPVRWPNAEPGCTKLVSIRKLLAVIRGKNRRVPAIWRKAKISVYRLDMVAGVHKVATGTYVKKRFNLKSARHGRIFYGLISLRVGFI